MPEGDTSGLQGAAGDARGPEVDAKEDLYRMITTKTWWVAGEGRPSSAAFDEPKFSVNVASLTSVDESLRQLREVLGKPNGGLVVFNCGEARDLGFDARLELDEQYPNNTAHAHVYYEGGEGRKKKARQLAKQCRVAVAPTF